MAITKHEVRAIPVLFAAATSPEIDLQDWTLCGLLMPSSFTGTSLTVTVSDASTADGGIYVAMTDPTGSAYTITVATSKYVRLPPADFAGVPYMKLVSGSSESTTVKLMVRKIL